jgi:hypothetical protein
VQCQFSWTPWDKLPISDVGESLPALSRIRGLITSRTNFSDQVREKRKWEKAEKMCAYNGGPVGFGPKRVRNLQKGFFLLFSKGWRCRRDSNPKSILPLYLTTRV